MYNNRRKEGNTMRKYDCNKDIQGRYTNLTDLYERNIREATERNYKLAKAMAAVTLGFAIVTGTVVGSYVADNMKTAEKAKEAEKPMIKIYEENGQMVEELPAIKK